MRRLWRVTLWGGGAVLTLAGIAAVLGFAMFHKFYPTPPQPDYPAPRNEAIAQRQDLDYFRQYLTYNRAYNPMTREKAQQLLSQTDAKAGAMSHGQFALAIARMVALSDNGHSTILMSSLSRRNNRLPCRLYHFDDGYYVIRARGGCASLLGAKVVAIDGQPIDSVADGMFRYVEGPRNRFDQFQSVAFLESPELLEAAGYAVAPNRLTLTVETRDGLRHDVSLAAEPADAKAPRVYSDALLSPQPIPGEGGDWKPLLPRNSKMPLFLRDYGNPFRTQFIPEHGVLYIQFRANADQNGHSISRFVSQVKHELHADKPRFVILDLRLDQGGNLVTTADLMQTIPRTKGVQHVYLLTSAWTFSAGLVSAAVVKHDGGSKVTVIGENVGDRLRFWAEGGVITLPNSKLRIGFATGLHDYQGSCWGEPDCFWLQLFIHPRLKSLKPDVPVPYRFADYLQRRDPLLDTALRLAEAEAAATSRRRGKL